MRLLRLRQFQAIVRHQVFQEGARVEDPLFAKGIPVNEFLLNRLTKPSLENGTTNPSLENATTKPFLDGPTQRFSSVIQKVSLSCDRHLRQIPVGQQLLRVKLDRLMADLPLHYKKVRRHWRKRKEAVRETAAETCKRIGRFKP